MEGPDGVFRDGASFPRCCGQTALPLVWRPRCVLGALARVVPHTVLSQGCQFREIELCLSEMWGPCAQSLLRGDGGRLAQAGDHPDWFCGQ